MILNPRLLDVIACPICKGKLRYDRNQQVLVCNFNRLSFPIKDGVPMMLAEQAQPIFQSLRERRHR